MSEGQQFVTEDMTFVTVLLIEGIHHDEMVNQNGGCRWVYRGDALVARIVEELLPEYNDDSYHVEVKDFVRKLGHVRKEMYRFLKYQPPRVRAAG